MPWRISIEEQKKLKFALEQFKQGQQDIQCIEQKTSQMELQKLETEQVIKILKNITQIKDVGIQLMV